MTKKLILLLVIILIMNTCFGDLTLFGWSKPRDNVKQSPPENYPSKYMCGRPNSPCNEKKVNHDIDEESLDDENEEFSYRDKGNHENDGIYVAKPRYDTDVLDKADFDDDLDDNNDYDGDEISEEEDDIYEVEDDLKFRIPKHNQEVADEQQRWEKPSSRVNKFRKFTQPSHGQQRVQKKHNKQMVDIGKHSRFTAGETSTRRDKKTLIAYQDMAIKDSYDDDEVESPFRNKEPTFQGDDISSDYDDDELETRYSKGFDRLGKQTEDKRGCCNCGHSNDRKVVSVESKVGSSSHDSLKQATEPDNPAEKKEVTTSSHLYKTSLFVGLIWLFNVAFVIWSMTRKNYVIKMKVPSNVDLKHPLISDIHKNALNERKDKTSQTAVLRSKVNQKHQHPWEGDSNVQLPLYQPEFPPPPLNLFTPKDITANQEPNSRSNSLSDIPARLYFNDVHEPGKYNQMSSSSYLNTTSRLVKEYTHPRRRFDYHDARLDQATRNYEETPSHGVGEVSHTGPTGIGEAKTTIVLQPRKSRPGYSSGMAARNEKVTAENNSNYSVPKLSLYEERSSWTDGRKLKYSSFGVRPSSNINNQHFSDGKITSKDYMPAQNTFFLNRDLPRSISPRFNEKIKSRSLSNDAAKIHTKEENMLKSSRIKRSFSATTQCPSVHSVKYEHKLNAARIEAQNSNMVEAVCNTLKAPLSMNEVNIQGQTEEKSPMKKVENNLNSTKIADVLTRYLDEVNRTGLKFKHSPEVKPETERMKANDNLYKLFSNYGNQLQNYSSLDGGRSRPKPEMPPPPLGYHIRSCCSSSDTTLRELESKSELSDQAPSSGEQTSQGQVMEKKRKRKGLNGQMYSPHKMKASQKIDKLLLNGSIMKQMCAGDSESRKKYVIVRKVSFSKALKHGNYVQSFRRKSNVEEKQDREKRDRNFDKVEYPDSCNTKPKRSKRESKERHQSVTSIPYFQNKHPNPCYSESKKYLLYLCEPSSTTQLKRRGKNCTVSSQIRYAERNTNNAKDYLKHTLNKVSLNKINEPRITHPCFNYRPVLKRKLSYKNVSLYGDNKYYSAVPCALDINTNNGGSSEKENGDSYAEGRDLVSLSDVTDSTVVPPIEDENVEDNAEELSSMLEQETKKERTPVKASKHGSPTSKGPAVEDAWENRKSIIMQACHEAIKSRLQKQNSEDGCAEEKTPTLSAVEIERKFSLPTKLYQDQLSDEKSRSSTSSSDEINKRKKKAKRTESMFVKFESNRKVTATTAKDRKTSISKASLEQKTVEDTKLDEADKKSQSDIVKGTKVVKKSEMETSDIKTRHNSESCSETASNKENMLNSWEVQETEEDILNSKESDHCFDAVKDLLSAACKGEDFGVSKPLSIHNSSSPNLTSTKNVLDEVKVKNVTSDTINDKGSKFRATDNAISRSASDVKELTRKSESSSSHKLKDRGAKRTRHKGTGSPLGQKKTIKKKRTSTSRSKKTADEGIKEKSKDPLKKTHFLAVSKKSPNRTGSSKSGESKIRKKSSKTKESHGDDTSTSETKTEKVKTKKISEKTEKKKRKVKKREECEQLSDKEENSCLAKHSASAPVRILSLERSPTPSPRSCSTPLCRSASPVGTPTKGRVKERKSSKKCSKSEISIDLDKGQTAEKSRSLDRQMTTNEISKGRKKSSWTSSADNIGATGTNKRLRSTESVPLFVDKVISNQSIKSDKDKPTPNTSSAKLKKGEKDLQKAELGWNSSLAYDNLKQAEEKSKMLQSRKIKYMIVKAKHDKIVPRLRNNTQRSNPAEGESVGSHSENELKSDATSRDKVIGGNQPKSVQFSESIEDMEAQRNAPSSDGYLVQTSHLDVDSKQRPGDNSDSVDQDDIGSVDKPPEIMDTINEKSQEVTQRSQSTPPARKRPVWLKGKKIDESKASEKQPMQPRQLLSGLPMKLKLRHSSDTIMKGTRVSGHLFYPGKPSVSPKTNSMTLNTKTASYRNASLTPAMATAPPTKSKKKAIATVGSPVDLMEIIEGSSVDASDHSKAFVVRPTKSVPAFGHSRGGHDAVAGKRLKSAFEQRVLASKRKNKILDNLSIRSVSSNDTGDEHLRSLGRSYDPMTSPTPSVMTDLDEVASVNRLGQSSSGLHGQIRRKDKKIKKRVQTVNSNINWQLVAHQEQDHTPRVPYDYNDYDVFQLGLSWMVQRFFNSITSFSPGQRSNPNASGDMSIHRIAE